MPSQNRNNSQSVGARAPEPAGAPHALLQLLHLEHLGRVDPLNDQLRNPVALLHLKVGLAVVEQQDLDGSPVVGVDDAGARVDEVLGGEAGAGGDAAVCFATDSSVLYVIQESGFWAREEPDSQVPAGTDMLMSVSTSALPREGMVVSRAAYRS